MATIQKLKEMEELAKDLLDDCYRKLDLLENKTNKNGEDLEKMNELLDDLAKRQKKLEEIL